MGLLRKFQQILPMSSLLIIYKTFIGSRLDYADIIYDQAYNSGFHDKLESIQYNACLALTSAIRCTTTEKIYQELGLQYLKSRCWLKKLCQFYKIFNKKSSSYLFNLIPNFNRVSNTRLIYNIPPIKGRHDYFKNSFFSFCCIRVEQASKLETQQASILLKRSFQTSYGLVPIVFLIFIIPLESNS